MHKLYLQLCCKVTWTEKSQVMDYGFVRNQDSREGVLEGEFWQKNSRFFVCGSLRDFGVAVDEASFIVNDLRSPLVARPFFLVFPPPLSPRWRVKQVQCGKLAF